METFELKEVKFFTSVFECSNDKKVFSSLRIFSLSLNVYCRGKSLHQSS